MYKKLTDKQLQLLFKQFLLEIDRRDRTRGYYPAQDQTIETWIVPGHVDN